MDDLSVNPQADSRLATTNASGERVYVYPEDVKGIWRDRRTFFYWMLILSYCVLPWTTWNGKQTILLDLPKREFIFFGNTFFGHDAPLLIFLFLAITFGIGFLTSLFGRVWCGWGCPQTVFIDAIFRPIERLIEGRSRARRNLDRAPWSVQKVVKKLLKWSLFTIVSLHIAHSFVGYFTGTSELFWITLSPPSEHPTLFTITLFITAIILFDFGWFREQFCIIACPYGRIQSVMMDENSLVVAYDKSRGEPRRSKDQKIPEGDCISCNHCVKVCPTGIDIRNGTQLECIACTNCIDACDEIMEKVGRDPGLIKYTTENELKGEKTHWFRFRTAFYLFILVILLLVGSWFIGNAQDVDISLLKASRSPFIIRNEIVTNQYKLRLSHKGKDTSIRVKHEGSKGISIILAKNPIILKKGVQTVPLFFKFSPSELKNGKLKTKLLFIDDKSNKTLETMEVILVGPY